MEHELTPQTAGVLALAIHLRDEAAKALLDLRAHGAAESPEAVALAETFIHEQRIINRITSDGGRRQ